MPPLPFKQRPRTLAVYAAIVVLVVAAGIVALAWPRSKSCRLAADGAPTCGVLWGSALHATNSKLPSAVSAREQSTGRRMDIVHTYHRWYDAFPTASESKLAASGHLLFLNWEPIDRNGKGISWSSIATGAHDAQIDAEAKRLAALPSVYVSFSHEPENDYRQHGAIADFAAAFRHVHDRMRAAGATNVHWVWDMMGLSDPVWLARYKTMWPGAAYVDWVAWDPYNWGTCRSRAWRSFSETVRPFYDWLENNGFGGKPFMLAEYGSVEKPGDAQGKADWYAGIPDALRSLPNLRALVYFDLPAPPANCNWLISTSTAAIRAFGTLARSTPFGATAKVKIKKSGPTR